MAQLRDAQVTFDGGVTDRLSAELLPDNAYYYGLNLEVRDGPARSRRGSSRLVEWLLDTDTIQGVGVYRAPFADQRAETILLVRGGDVFQLSAPEFDADIMGLPGGESISTEITVRFVQAYNYIYMLRGSAYPPMRWDGYAASDWEAVPAASAGDDFPWVDYAAYAYNRLWAVDGESTVEASDALSEAFDLTNHAWEIDSGTGDKLTALVPLSEGTMLALKERSAHLIGNCNTDLSGLTREVLDPKHGCIATDSAVRLGNDVWYLSRDGVRSIMLTVDNKVQLRDLTLTHPIPHMVDRINWNYAHNARAVVFDNYYLLAVPFDEAELNDTILVYDLILKAWVGIWQGTGSYNWDAVHLFTGRRRNQEVLYCCNEAGDLIELLTDSVEDVVPKRATHLYFHAQNQNVDLSPVLATAKGTTLKAATDGFITCRFRYVAAVSPGSICELHAVNGAVTGELSVAANNDQLEVEFFHSGAAGASYWAVRTDGALLADVDKWYEITVTHDGTAPVLHVDGAVPPQTFYSSEDKTKWIADLPWGGGSEAFTFGAGTTYSDPVTGLYAEFAAGEYSAGNPSHLCILDLANGTGTNVEDNESGATCPFGGTPPTWQDLTGASSFQTWLITRGFHFRYPLNMKRVLAGEVEISHMTEEGPLVYGHPDRPNEVIYLIDGVSYDHLKYDVFGKPDWDETGATFNDPHRQVYAPFVLPSAGMKLPTAGIRLDLEQTHVEKFHAGQLGRWYQLGILITSGVMAVRRILLTASVLWDLRSDRGDAATANPAEGAVAGQPGSPTGPGGP